MLPPARAPLPLHDAALPARTPTLSAVGKHQPSGPRRTPVGADTWEGPHVTDTIESTPAQTSGDAGAPAAKKKSGGLNSLLLADLKSMAGGLGIRGAGSKKKAQLVDAIKAAQAGGRGGSQGRPADPDEAQPAQASQRESQRETQPETQPEARRDDGEPGGTQQQERRGDRQQGDGQSLWDQSSADQSAGEQSS